MQGYYLNDYYSQWFFYYLRNSPHFSKPKIAQKIMLSKYGRGKETRTPSTRVLMVRGIRGSFLKSQIAKRLIPFDMSLL